MMAPENVVLDEREAAPAPMSVRLLAKHGVQPIATKAADRRAHPRVRAADLSGIRGARLKAGPDVTLVDLSTGGALLETDVQLRPGSVLSLEIIGPETNTVVPFEVLRSQISRIVGAVPMYRGACAFATPLDLRALAGDRDTGAGTAARKAFVGFEAAIEQLVAAAGSGDGKSLLRPREVVEVLRALRTRAMKHRGEPFGRYLAGLLTIAVQGLEANRSTAAIVGAIEEQIDRLAVAPALARREADAAAALVRGGHDARLVRTGDLLIVLVERVGVSRDARAAASGTDETATSSATAAAAPAGWQKIVVRFVEGRILKGYTQDFHPSRPQLSLWPAINAPAPERVVVPLARLKAVFFVRDFGGNPDYVERNTFEGATHGRRIEVTFADDEVVLGTTLNYRADGQGFFLVPADPRANNVRIFVVPSAVRHVRFPPA